MKLHYYSGGWIGAFALAVFTSWLIDGPSDHRPNYPGAFFALLVAGSCVSVNYLLPRRWVEQSLVKNRVMGTVAGAVIFGLSLGLSLLPSWPKVSLRWAFPVVALSPLWGLFVSAAFVRLWLLKNVNHAEPTNAGDQNPRANQ